MRTLKRILLLSVRVESKANAGHGTEWKDNSSRGGKAALRRLKFEETEKRCRLQGGSGGSGSGKKKRKKDALTTHDHSQLTVKVT
jgi:hypothetical protein